MADILSQKTPFDKLFQRAGEQYGVDPSILKSMAFVESSFNPEAVGPSTKYGRAQGLMQFMPATARAYKLRNPFDPNQAIPAAARYMKDLINQFDGDVSKALEAYNGGPRLVGRSSQTKEYAQKVMNFARGPRSMDQEPLPTAQGAVRPQITAQEPRTMDQPLVGAQAPVDDGRQAVLESAQLALQALPNYSAALNLFMQDTGDSEEEYNQYSEALGPELASAVSDYVPQQMAHGGYVQKHALGGMSVDVIPGAVPYLSQQEKDFIEGKQKYFDEYNAQVGDYTSKADEYNAAAKKYQDEVDAYNKAVEEYNAGPRTSDFTLKPPEFTATAPTAPELTYTPEELEAYAQAANKRAQQSAAARNTAVAAVMNPDQFNFSRFSLSPFKDGGDVRVPSQSEVPQLDESGRVITTPLVAPPPEKEFSPMDYALGAADVGSVLLKGAVVEPYALARGLYEQAQSNEPRTSRRIAEAKAEEIRQAAGVAPRTEAGGELLQKIAKMAEEAKIPPLIPQLYGLPRTPKGAVGQGAVLATEEAVLPVMRKITGNEGLTSEQVFRAMADPRETLKAGAPAAAPKAPISTTLLTPSDINPFVGEMERRIADLPGAVRKEQFLASLKGKARDYEIVRMEQALEGFDANAKLTPQQLMDAVKSTSPQRYNLSVIEPKANQFFSSTDNPYPNSPVGTVNLTLGFPPEQKVIVDAIADASSLKNRYWGFHDFANKPGALDEVVTSSNKIADAIEGFSSADARKIRKAANALEQESAPVIEATNRLRAVQFPFVDKRLAALEFGNLEDTADPKILSYLKDNGIDVVGDRLHFKLKYLTLATARDNLNEAVKAYNAMPDASPAIEKSLPRWNKNIDTFLGYIRRLDEKDLFSKSAADRNAILSAVDNFEKIAFDFMDTDRDYKILSNAVEQKGEKLYRQLRSALQDAVESEDIQKTLGYRGKPAHRSIVSDNPISFARFVDLDSNTPGVSDARGAMFFPELQSDRYSVVRKEVPWKDLEGKPKIDPETGRYIMSPNWALDPTVEEAYPGMSTLSPDIIQQLIMKSTIGAAAKRGKGIVLFPSPEDSNQPQLYEKVMRNAKQVAKDMGKGYEAKQFEVANEKGEMIKRWGIILPEDAQERIGREGIRFAKGGMVDKPLYDRA